MSYTYYQAKNQEDQVTEEEFPIRLQTINSSINALEQKTDRITRDGDTTTIPNIVTADIQIRDNGPDSSMRISTIEGQAAAVIKNYTKLIECYGALTATNITSNNKNDIEALEDKTQNIIRIPGTDEDPTSHTEIDGVSFQTTLGRITNIEGTLTKVSYDPMEELVTISGKLTVNRLNGNKIGAPATFKYNDEAPFIPVVDVNDVIEVGRYIDFHAADTSHDFWTRLEYIGQNALEITGTGSMRMTRIDVSAGMALRTGNTLLRFMKTDNSTNMLTLNNDINEATFLGNIVAPSLNGNKIGASNEGFGYTTYAPYIPVWKANGITELGYRIDFHLTDATFRDFSAYLSNTALNTLRIYGTTDNSGTLETNVLAIRTNGEDVRLQLSTNQYHNLSMFNRTGTQLWILMVLMV